MNQINHKPFVTGKQNKMKHKTNNNKQRHKTIKINTIRKTKQREKIQFYQNSKWYR